MDFTYYTPWKYLGFRFQGAGGSLSTGNFSVSEAICNSSGDLVAFGKRSGYDFIDHTDGRNGNNFVNCQATIS
jgi:hypothetical protein